MRKISLSILLLIAGWPLSLAQVGINTDGSSPDPSSGLDVKFTDKGFLLPRLTSSQRDAITSPAEGLMVFCTNCGSEGSLSIYSNGSWKTFSPCSIASPTAGTNTVSPGQVIWTWNAVAGASGYKWSATNNYSTATDMGTSLTKSETGIACGTAYTRYVWSYNSCSFSFSATLTETIPASAPSTPAAGTHVSTKTQITWNWNTVSGAKGYRWSNLNDFATATEMGLSTSKVEGSLTCGTPYTRYAWAYNGCGYSTPVTLTQSTLACLICGYAITDPRDGKTYNTVLIGTQCWFLQNLNVGTRINGSQNQTNNGIIEKYCYSDNEANCNTYGGLYQWDELMQYVSTEGAKGLCPDGWHIPTDAEWSTLTTYLGGESVAGGKMKEAGTSHWASPNTGATNSSGFTALPGGYRDSDGSFYLLTYYAYFWSSSQYDATYAWYRGLNYNYEFVGRYYYDKTLGFSCRCLQD
jgi:uncharacterized protein (TIGR02145 family)